MAHVVRRLLVLGLAICSVSSGARAGDGALPPASRWVPERAVIVIQVSQPKAVLDLVLGKKVNDLVTAHPAYRAWSESEGFQNFVQVVGFLEAQLGTEWKPAVYKLLEGGVTLSVLPGGASVLIVDTGDESLLSRLHEIVVQGRRDEDAKNGQPDRVASRDVNGVTVWTFNGTEAHAIIGKRLVVASDAQTLKAVLEQREHHDRTNIDASARYQAAKKAAGQEAVATAYADLNALKQIPKLSQALSQAENPLGELLLAGIRDALKNSSWLSLGLSIKGESLALRAVADGKPGAASAFMSPTGSAGALPILCVPRQLAGLSFYRDLHAFYTAKDQLFPERTSGLIFFENMMGIFFSGRDLTEEVFGETSPEVRLVAAAQQYDKAVGAPRVQIPAFALVLRAKHADEFARVAEEAWQKAIGLTAVTRGQQAEPGLIIDREDYHGVRFSFATNARGKDDDKAHLPSRFNFSPALARVGDCFVLSSTAGLARDLIDALNKTAKTANPLAGMHTMASADGVQLSELLKANRETLIERNMVEKGHARDQAEHEIDAFTAIARLIGQATLTGQTCDGLARVELGVNLNLP
jgi:hypothetical protein